jgi:hypothetical protein
MPTIAVINQAPNDVSDADLGLWVHAIQRQVLENVLPFWPNEAAGINLVLVPHGSTAPSGAWQVIVAPTIREAQDLGFHDFTSSFNFFQGTVKIPEGFVSTQVTRADGQTISRVLSHEIIEMVVDPDVDRKVTIDGTTFLAEACDPVHPDRMGYKIDGVLVSNFITPRYYGFPSQTTDPRHDFLGLLTAPCPILPSGGALAVLNGNQIDLRIGPDTPPDEAEILAIRSGSRRDRYQKGRGTRGVSGPGTDAPVA